MQAPPNVGKAQKTGGKGSRKEQLDFAEGEKAAAGNDSNNDSNEAEAEEGEDEMDQRYESEDSQEAYDDENTYNSVPKRVRQNLATIRIPQPQASAPIVFSYHYKYEKYLRDHNLIDPEKAK